MSAGLYAALAVGVGLGAYALYRASETGSGKVKVQDYKTGAGNVVDYKNPADATNDKRPEAAYLVKPYQILNVGGGGRPMEVDAQGQPTGRELQLPGESANKNSVIVGAEKAYSYQNARDAHVDTRPEAAYLVKPYEIFNPGGGIRPYEIDAQGQATGRQLVLPGESPTVANAAQYVMVGQGLAEHGLAWRGATAIERPVRAAAFAGRTRTRGENIVGVPLHGWQGSGAYGVPYGGGYNPYGGGGLNPMAMSLARRRRMMMLRQQMLQQQLAQQQMEMQQQLADQQAQAELLAQQQLGDDGMGGDGDFGLGV